MQPGVEPESYRGRPQYYGEDTRLTSKKELSGWYSYGFAAEVYVVCGVGTPNTAAVPKQCTVVLIRAS